VEDDVGARSTAGRHGKWMGTRFLFASIALKSVLSQCTESTDDGARVDVILPLQKPSCPPCEFPSVLRPERSCFLGKECPF
jgi:hypothetical protein